MHVDFVNKVYKPEEESHSLDTLPLINIASVIVWSSSRRDSMTRVIESAGHWSSNRETPQLDAPY